MPHAALPRVSQSPTDDSFVQDPYPFYDRLRALGDLVWWEEYAMPMATSHAAVGAFLRDKRFGREVPQESQRDVPAHLAAHAAFERHSMLEREPPAHTRLRSLVLRAFTSRRIAALAPEIRDLCSDLIDAFPKGDFDLLNAYARPIPVIVIARLLGVDPAMADQLLTWSNAMVAIYQARRSRAIEDAAEAATNAFSDFIRETIAIKRRAPADDLITHLIAAEESGERLSTDELITTCILLLNAGHEASVHTIGLGVKLILSRHLTPLAGPTEALIEEVLRFDPPLHLFTRYAYEKVELFGHVFERGDQVGCLLGSAGHDEKVYQQASIFDPMRPRIPHHAFGAGIHFCVGAPLARLELECAFEVLFARCPDLHLVGTPRFAPLYHFHGLERLVVNCAK